MGYDLDEPGVLKAWNTQSESEGSETQYEVCIADHIVEGSGSPREEIVHHKDLRQGNPLSPMLFILAMCVLNLLIIQASQDGLLQPLLV